MIIDINGMISQGWEVNFIAEENKIVIFPTRPDEGIEDRLNDLYSYLTDNRGLDKEKTEKLFSEFQSKLQADQIFEAIQNSLE